MAALIPHEKDNDGGLEDILRECNNFNQCRLELLEDNEEIEVFCKKEKKLDKTNMGSPAIHFENCKNTNKSQKRK